MKCFIPEGKSLSANQVVQLLQEPYTEQDLSDPNWRVEDMVAVIEANKEEHKADLEQLRECRTQDAASTVQ